MVLVRGSCSPMTEIRENMILRKDLDCAAQLRDGLGQPIGHLLFNLYEINVFFR